MKFSINHLLILSALSIAMQGCGNKQKYAANLDQYTNDSAKIVVDEAFRPIFDEELTVLKALNQKLHPRIVYRPENQAINMLMLDSARVLVAARPLDTDEIKTLKGRTLVPVTGRFAIDAVAIIVNKSSADSSFTVSQLKGILNGTIKTDKQIIFDNPNSGMVRYLQEFSGSKDLKQKNIFSLKSNKDVIRWVAQHPDAVGITDFSWFDDPTSDYAGAVDDVKVASVNDDTNKKLAGRYFKPSQTTIALKQYPLTRDLYIINCTGNMSTGKKIADFLKSERGQLIIVRSGLLPDNIPDRQVEIVTK